MSTSNECYRVPVMVMLAAFLAACTEAVPMHRQVAIERHEFYDHTMRIRLTSGDTIETKRMTVTESSVTIHELKRRFRSDKLDEPLVIPMSDVEGIERIEFDESNTIATAATLGLLLFVAWVFSGFDFGD